MTEHKVYPITEGPPEVANANYRIDDYLMWTWLAIIGVALVHRIAQTTSRYLRHYACMSNIKQVYFRYPNLKYAALKRHLLDAPLLRKRHRDPFMPTERITFGTPPSRLQVILIVAYFALNIGLVTTQMPFGSPEVSEILILRTGGLAIMNMVPLFVLAGRNNPLINLLGIGFNTFNLLHRWIGRVVVTMMLTHGLTWAVASVKEGGWSDFTWELANVRMITCGFIAAMCMLTIILTSNAIVRRASYEVFLHTHILLVLTIVTVLYYHLKDLTQQRIVLILISIWAVERLIRVARLVRANVGAGGTKAEVEAMAGDAMRITLHIARPWTFKPGQYVFLYIPSVGWWTSHPFALAWSDEQHHKVFSEKGLPMTSYDARFPSKTTMSMIVRRRNGFTDKLWQRATRSPTGTYVTSALVEGPYGGHNLDSFGSVMLFAAGVGITHQMPYVRHLVAGYAKGSTATRQITLVWILQNPEHLDWIRPWMEPILAMEKRREVLRILLFITRPRSTKEIRSPSQTVQMFPGKPNVDMLIAKEQTIQQGAMAVSVCGTGSLSDDVRASVRKRSDQTNIELVDKFFGW